MQLLIQNFNPVISHEAHIYFFSAAPFRYSDIHETTDTVSANLPFQETHAEVEQKKVSYIFTANCFF